MPLSAVAGPTMIAACTCMVFFNCYIYIKYKLLEFMEAVFINHGDKDGQMSGSPLKLGSGTGALLE